MGQAKNRKAEIEALKSSKPFAIQFSIPAVAEMPTMFIEYSAGTLRQMKADRTSSDECFEIITKHAGNVAIGSKSQNLSPAEANQVQQSIRAVALSVLRMVLNDEYKAVAAEMQDVVLTVTIDEVDGDIGLCLTPDKQSLFLLAKGIEAQKAKLSSGIAVSL